MQWGEVVDLRRKTMVLKIETMVPKLQVPVPKVLQETSVISAKVPTHMTVSARLNTVNVTNAKNMVILLSAALLNDRKSRNHKSSLPIRWKIGLDLVRLHLTQMVQIIHWQ